MKLFYALLISFFMIFISSNLVAQENGSDKNEINIAKFDPSRNAQEDLNAAIKEAKKNNKNIILDVGGEWCIWCHRLDTMFIKNPDVYQYLTDNYVYLKINYSKENKNEKFLSQFPEIPGYPHWFVLDSDGNLLVSKSSGDFEAGKGHDPKIVIAFLKEWRGKKKS